MTDPFAVRKPTKAEIDRVHALVDALDAEAGRFEIGSLQIRRAAIKNLKRVEKKVFGDTIGRNRSADWAYHHGGRTELQFNVAFDVMPDGLPAFRTGVAFSLEDSQTLPVVSALEPHIRRFNAWMGENPEAFADLGMWHYHRGQRSPDYRPGPIPLALVNEAFVTQETFIFLGDRQPLWDVDLDRALGVMDRLLPLWEWIEHDIARGEAATPDAAVIIKAIEVFDTLSMEGREIDGGRWISASTRERTFDIYLRHAEIQRRLKAQLLAEGYDQVVLEAKLGQRAIDVVARRGQALCFFEVKTAASDRSCLREAIGQLLEYSLWPGATRPDSFVVVGEPPLTEQGKAYLEALQQVLRIPLAYRCLALA